MGSSSHNLGVVIKFEIVRALKKPAFWFVAVGFPVLMIAIFGIVFLSNQATSQAAEDLKNQQFSILIKDESGLIDQRYIEALGAKTTEDRQAGIDAVKDGETDAFFLFPADVSSQKIEIYADDVGVFENSRYSAVANSLLMQSVNQQVDPQQRAILQDQTVVATTMFRDGEVYDGIKEMILPGSFLVLFYFLIAIFGNQMLTSSIEEKENRTIEMLLTMVRPNVLIVGKVLSLIVLSLVMGLVTMLPVIIGFVAFGSQFEMLGIDLTNLPVDFGRIATAVTVFGLSFMLFTGILVAVGAAMPTAKEASQWFGIVMMLIFGPLYGVSAFVSYPDSPIVQFLSLFPLTSPIPLMLRNAIGNLPLGEALLGIAILTISTTLVMMLAVKMYRYGAMQYDSRLSLKMLRAKRS